jgi:hypothetical protein
METLLLPLFLKEVGEGVEIFKEQGAVPTIQLS